MNDFTASNGIHLHVTPGQISDAYLLGTDKDEKGTVGFVPELHATASQRGLDALREFFQAEADERLGRWRDPAQPEFLVYPVPGDGSRVQVVDETTGVSYGATRASARDGHGSAAHYFDAHPEPKPWHEAAPAEVWILMFRESSHAWFVNGDYFQSTKTLTNISKTDEGIIAGRRIYPDEVAS